MFCRIRNIAAVQQVGFRYWVECDVLPGNDVQVIVAHVELGEVANDGVGVVHIGGEKNRRSFTVLSCFL